MASFCRHPVLHPPRIPRLHALREYIQVLLIRHLSQQSYRLARSDERAEQCVLLPGVRHGWSGSRGGFRGRLRFLYWHTLPLRNLLDNSPLCDGRLGFLRRRLLGSPPFLQSGDDVRLARRRKLPFGLASLFWCGRFSHSPGGGPSLALSLGNSLPAGGTHLTALALWRFRRGGGLSGATTQDGPEFGNLSVDVPFLLLESEDGGGDDFWSEFCWHVIEPSFGVAALTSTGGSVRDAPSPLGCSTILTS